MQPMSAVWESCCAISVSSSLLGSRKRYQSRREKEERWPERSKDWERNVGKWPCYQQLLLFQYQYPTDELLETCENHLYYQTNWKHLVQGPKTVNPRNWLSHFIALGKTRKGKIGQGFKEEKPSAKSSHQSFLPMQTACGEWGLRQALPRGLPIRQRVSFVSQSLLQQHGRRGQVHISAVFFLVKGRE